MKTRLFPTLLGVLFLCPALWAQPDNTLSPYFYLPGEDGTKGDFPLLETKAEVDIAGVIADVRITQRYHNDGAVPLEAIYVFPGSTRAAVYDMQMRVGERRVQAVVREKGEARTEYDAARRSGRRASLLEQERPNVFQMNVANIMPGDTVEVTLRYTEWLTPEEGIYEFVYPTVVGPRYGGEAVKPQLVADRWVSNPYLTEGQPEPYLFSLDLRLRGGVPLSRVSSRTHKIDVEFDGKTEASLRLDGGGNRDFILEYQLQGEQQENGLLLYEGEKENFFLLLMQPPKRPEFKKMPAREYILIVDVSGSMDGFPLDVSKQLLRDLIGRLNPSDRFNVLLFEYGVAVLSPQSLPATKENLEMALRIIDGQSGGGGTNMLAAIQQAMALSRPEGFSRSFVIATDGFVSVEPQLFDYIRQNLGEANFFAFGIGSGVNRHLIEGMAHLGGSEPFVVTDPKEAPEAAEKFREYISTPVLTDVSVDFGNWDVYDVSPANVPDLLSERPVIIFGKYRGEAKGKISLRGRNADGLHSQVLKIADADRSAGNQALRYLWARHRLRELADYQNLFHGSEELNSEVIRLGLEYNLLTANTSFVAVDREIANPEGNPNPVKQPLPLPKGAPNSAIGIDDGFSALTEESEFESVDQSIIIDQFVEAPPTSWNGAMPTAPPPPPSPAVEEAFKVVEEMPRFPAPDCESLGTIQEKKSCADRAMLNFIYKHLQYPEGADCVEGTVVVQFTVDKDGSLIDIKVVRDIGGGCGEEAKRVIQLMNDLGLRWTPGKQRGRAVKVQFNLPVKFRLE